MVRFHEFGIKSSHEADRCPCARAPVSRNSPAHSKSWIKKRVSYRVRQECAFLGSFIVAAW